MEDIFGVSQTFQEDQLPVLVHKHNLHLSVNCVRAKVAKRMIRSKCDEMNIDALKGVATQLGIMHVDKLDHKRITEKIIIQECMKHFGSVTKPGGAEIYGEFRKSDESDLDNLWCFFSGQRTAHPDKKIGYSMSRIRYYLQFLETDEEHFTENQNHIDLCFHFMNLMCELDPKYEGVKKYISDVFTSDNIPSPEDF
jgi:hypothetical protein